MANPGIQIIQPIEQALVSIGYRTKFLQQNYEYIDFFSNPPKTRSIDLGVFGREPLDYRSACFGFCLADNGKPSESVVDESRALGASQIFVVRGNYTERWALTGKGRSLKEQFETKNTAKVITENKDAWSPHTVLRAKSGFCEPGVRQLDFIDIGFLPALEKEANEKLDELIKKILHKAEHDFKQLRNKFDPKEVFRIVFSFLAAKLLKDRDIKTDPLIDFLFPENTLKAVSHYYGETVKNVFPKYISSVSEEFKNCFSFRNLSVDTLTYIYENTFVSESKRKELGIHSTPSYIADYILAQMPIDKIPRHRWKVFDPMCGHGIFLIAAMRRMRDLLPDDWSGQRRHQLFGNVLRGVEIDPFAVEVATLCLRLADFPEQNGWKIINDDVFHGNILKDQLGDTTILVGNPPFEIIQGKKPDTPKPVELLNRALPNLPHGALIGMVFPNSFLDGSDYKKTRGEFLDHFEILSLTSLPDRIFPYSDSETAIIVARKQKAANEAKTYYREVREPQRKAFQFTQEVTWEDYVSQSYFKKQKHGYFIVPLIRELWEVIKNNPTLVEIAEIKKGVEYESTQISKKHHEFIRSEQFRGSVPGIVEVTDDFTQFAVGKSVYMATNEHLRRKRALGAWDIDWKKEKIIVPTSRLSRGPWRTAGAVDRKGNIVSRNFYAIWPKIVGLSVETLAALINSPVAAAFLYAYGNKRDIPKRLYASIPIPRNISLIEKRIEQLVKQYLRAVKVTAIDEAREALLQIDADILRAYNFPPHLERQLLDLFWGYQRRVPFEFTGYIPPEEKSWIPLHIYISDKFSELNSRKIFERMPVINDQSFLNFLKELGMDSE